MQTQKGAQEHMYKKHNHTDKESRRRCKPNESYKQAKLQIKLTAKETTHWSRNKKYDYTDNNKKPAAMKKINEFTAMEGYIGRSEDGTTNSTTIMKM